MIEEGYLDNIGDIYLLKNHRQTLIAKGIIGKEKNTDKLLGVIEESKKNEAYRLIAGLSIGNVGKASAKTLMKHYDSIDALMHATVDQLQEVEDVGETTALAIHEFFHKESNIRLMERLKEYGLNMEAPKTEGSMELAGLTFVITGDVNHFKNRNELVEFIESKGGKAAGSVSGKTTALINNDASSNSGKNKKAKDLGIPILTEEEFLSKYGL